MSILKCFAAKIAAGTVKPEAGNPLAAEIARLETKLAEAGAEADAILGGYADFLRDRAESAARDKMNAYRRIDSQLDKARRIQSYIETVDQLRADKRAPLTLAGGAYRESALGAALRSVLTRDPHEIASGPNVNYARQQVRSEAHAQLAELIEAARPKMLGLKEETALELDILRALFEGSGSPKGDSPASRLAKAWLGTAESLRGKYNDAGGNIAMRDKWLMPQSHDSTKVASVNRDTWKEFVLPLLDREQMLYRQPDPVVKGRMNVPSEATRKLNDAELDALLDNVYDAIIARGADDAPSSAFSGRGALANQRSEARILAFRDADSWLSYKESFGAPGGIYDAMMAHVRDLSDDIGLMRVMGPDPEATYRYMVSWFDQEMKRLQTEAPKGADGKTVAKVIKDNQKLESEIRRDRNGFEALWAETTGANSVPVHVEAAKIMGTMRTALHGMQMGSAIVSSITDPGLMAVTARFNGISAMNVISRAIADMARPGAEISAAQMGLVADSIAESARRVDRHMGEEIQSGRVAQVSSAIIRASGLRRWTAILRQSFGLEYMAELARNQGKAFADMDPNFRKGLERVGVTETEWKGIAKAEAYQPVDGVRLLRPMDISGVDERLGAKLAQLVNTEMDYAVIEGDPLTRAFIRGQSQPGTGIGELRRAVGMYKAFPITFINLHFARAFARGWDGSRMGHAALTFAMLTGLGVVAMQAKEVMNGRDPLSLDPSTGNGARAWGKAVLQGGGLGVFGDIMFQDKTKFGNSWASTLAGPQFAAVEQILGTFLSANVNRALKGEDTHFGADALYVAGRYMPGSSLWFGRLAFQRQVLDQLALMIDERAPARFARMEAEAARNWGQSFWYAPGQSGPARAPDLTAIGGAP
jgi:hypothetical protein